MTRGVAFGLASSRRLLAGVGARGAPSAGRTDLGVVARLHARYRATGADLPFGDPLHAHGLAMEGYFWRLTHEGRSLIALIGVNAPSDGSPPWATLGLADSDGFLRTMAADSGWADPSALGARSGSAFEASADRVRVDLDPDARCEFVIRDPVRWPNRVVGGSSGFHVVPGLNQYWHPWLLGGRADGWAVLDEKRWDFRGAQVYAEKNWGRGGFPDAWWWGQAQGFDDPDACVAFAGGLVHAGPLRTTVTALVVRLPGGAVVRLGNPGISPVRADVTDERWLLHGRGGGWRIVVEGRAPLGDAHVLPVPLPDERRNTAGDLEHLAGDLRIEVRHRGTLVWSGHSPVAALEHGGLARAEAELRRRGIPPGVVDAPPWRGGAVPFGGDSASSLGGRTT
ncbi:MAG: tocopherol cyclase family protein [Dermatophilaceae bacterium]